MEQHIHACCLAVSLIRIFFFPASGKDFDLGVFLVEDGF